MRYVFLKSVCTICCINIRIVFSVEASCMKRKMAGLRSVREANSKTFRDFDFDFDFDLFFFWGGVILTVSDAIEDWDKTI